MPAAKPILLATSLSQDESSQTTPPRYTKLFTLHQLTIPQHDLHVLPLPVDTLYFSLCTTHSQIKSATGCVDFCLLAAADHWNFQLPNRHHQQNEG